MATSRLQVKEAALMLEFPNAIVTGEIVDAQVRVGAFMHDEQRRRQHGNVRSRFYHHDCLYCTGTKCRREEGRVSGMLAPSDLSDTFVGVFEPLRMTSTIFCPTPVMAFSLQSFPLLR